MASDSANLPGGKITFLLFLALVNFSFTIGIHNDNFSEELYVKPFSSGHVMFHFQFTTVWNVSIDKPESCKHTLYTVLFPMGLISYLCGISNEPLSWYTTSTFSMTSPFFSLSRKLTVYTMYTLYSSNRPNSSQSITDLYRFLHKMLNRIHNMIALLLFGCERS